MNTFLASAKRTCVTMGLFLGTSIIVVVAAGRTDILSSMLLGGLGSYIYFFLLAYRVYKSADMHPLVAIRYMRAGTGLRLGFICAMVVIGLKLPGIKFLPLFYGLYTYQFVVHIESMVTVVKEHLRSTKL